MLYTRCVPTQFGLVGVLLFILGLGVAARLRHWLLFASVVHIFVMFFFFQAEDGIRDADVTGVQTCALPISDISISTMRYSASCRRKCQPCPTMSSPARTSYLPPKILSALQIILPILPKPCITRSEERRVGKECRYRWLAEH